MPDSGTTNYAWELELYCTIRTNYLIVCLTYLLVFLSYVSLSDLLLLGTQSISKRYSRLTSLMRKSETLKNVSFSTHGMIADSVKSFYRYLAPIEMDTLLCFCIK